MSDNDTRTPGAGGEGEVESAHKIGGPTAQDMGTEYQIVSQAGRDMLGGGEGPVGNNPEGRADIGREPMYYEEKRSPEGTMNEDDMEKNEPQSDPSFRPGTASPRSGVPE